MSIIYSVFIPGIARDLLITYSRSQQVLRIRAERNLIAAQIAHSRASTAFNRLSDECEALLNRLIQAAEDVCTIRDSPSSESGLTSACSDTSHPLISGTASPKEQFEVLKQAVRLSRSQVESAAITLDHLQSKLLKAASDHSKIMEKLSILSAVDIDAASSISNDSDGDSIHGEQDSAITPISSNCDQPLREQNPDHIQPQDTPVIEYEAPDMTQLNYDKSGGLPGQQSGQRLACPCSTIGLIHPDDSSSEEDEDDDSEYLTKRLIC